MALTLIRNHLIFKGDRRIEAVRHGQLPLRLGQRHYYHRHPLTGGIEGGLSQLLTADSLSH